MASTNYTGDQLADDLQRELMTEADYDAEVARILQDYQSTSLRRRLLGPLASGSAHALLLLLLVVLIDGQTKPPADDSPVVTMIPMEIVELLPEVPDELETIKDPLDTTEQEPIPVEDPTPPTDIPPITNIDDDPELTPELPTDLPTEQMDLNIQAMQVVDYQTQLQTNVLQTIRSKPYRDRAVGQYNGHPDGQKAVERALVWLASVQQPDGSWEGPNRVACTGMALLTFLAHGETPLSETYGSTVQRACVWLAAAMINTPTNGNCGGRAYSHGIATYALAEAYAMTGIPRLRTAMDQGLARIIAGQQAGGGFAYNYAHAGGDGRWDLSVGGWQYQALKAGYMASSTTPGLEQAILKSVDFMKNDAYKGKKFGYAAPGTGGNMTGVGTVSLQLMGEADSSQVRGGLETIAAERLQLYRQILQGKADWKTAGGKSLYGWYYDTQAMFNAQGKAWREWQPVFEKVLVDNQHKDGYWAAEGHGFNDKDDAGRILSTCWATLQLEVYYRALPSYDIKKATATRVVSLDVENSGMIIR